jgi:hypothetical protein
VVTPSYSERVSRAEIKTHKVQLREGWPAPENVIADRLNFAKQGRTAEPRQAKLAAQFWPDSLRKRLALLEQLAGAGDFKL